MASLHVELHLYKLGLMRMESLRHQVYCGLCELALVWADRVLLQDVICCVCRKPYWSVPWQALNRPLPRCESLAKARLA